VKVPIYVQAGIHGNEYEGVDAMMRVIERIATTPYGADSQVDAVLDHVVLLVNVVQNPDGRVAGTRANGNGFDLNRDFLTQSQSETLASVGIMQEWIPPDMLDLHGYVTPTLIEATTKPHNPSIEYDMWLKWNQPRTLANKNALAAAGYASQRPINDWCSDADLPPCPPGETPGPAVAEGWDDWGPFYTPMYSQLVGLNASTVEMCRSETSCGGRLGARTIQEIVTWSTLEFDIADRHDLLNDELEIYRRGVTDAPRPECCPPPFDVDNDWMLEYPTAYVIPLGEGQRSNPEANRLVRWLLANGIEVSQLRKDFGFGSQTFSAGSYVVSMKQALRALADTALRIGVDVSPRIFTLYAPPAAWSHGYLWGADVVTIPRGTAFDPLTKPISAPGALAGGVDSGAADAYALEIDSATAVRALNGLVGDGVSAQLALAPVTTAAGETLPAGSAIFPADAATAAALAASGQADGLRFHAVSAPLPAVDPVESVPSIAVLAGALNQDIWSLRNLGFPADPVPTGTTSTLNDPALPDPLAGYDVVYNTAGWPAGATARARLTAFFAAGGGYLGAGSNGAGFLSATSSGQLPGLTTATSSGGGQSGIFYWMNTGGPASPIVGSYPGQDTAIMDPPTWFSAVPATAAVDGRLLGDTASTFAAGLWRFPRSETAAAAPIIVHGTSAAPGSAARITVFSMNPLYRADPEREWPMVGTAAYWADQ
jgi:Zinc carboxypeptidase